MVNDQVDPVFDADFFDFEEAPQPAPGKKLGKAKKKSTHVWDRDPHDWYVEPVDVTTALLRVERFVGPIWDPCCGGGNIPTAIDAAGYEVIGTDIVRRFPSEVTPSWWWGTFDFRDAVRSEGDHPSALPCPERYATNIVMNPPFFRAVGAEDFIRKAISIARGKVVAFVDIRFLGGAGRACGLFLTHPPSRVWVITPRVSCPPGSYIAGGGKVSNGSSDWCWMVWDLSAPTPVSPELGWIRRRAA